MQIFDVYTRKVYEKEGEQKATSYKAGALKVTDRGTMYLRLFHIPDVDFYIKERAPFVPGGNITNDGSATITFRGVCWDTSSNPTIANTTSTSGISERLYFWTISRI